MGSSKKMHIWFFNFTEKPSIDLTHLKDIRIRAGQEIKVALPIKGWPTPTAIWENGGEEIKKNGRNNMEVLID